MMVNISSFESLHFLNQKERLYFFALCLIPITFFLPLITNSIALGILGLMWIFNNPISGVSRLKKNKVGLGFIMLYVLHIIGMLYTENMTYGNKELEYKASMILIPLIISTGPKLGRQHLKIILRVFFTSLFLFVIVSYAMGAMALINSGDSAPALSYFTYRNFSTPMGLDPIYYALFIVFGIFSLVADKLISNDMSWVKPSKLFPWIVLTSFFVTLIFLSSRMEILVFIFCFIVLAIYYAVIKRQWLSSVLAVIVMLAISYSLISVNTVNKERFAEMVDLEEDYTENKWGGRSIRIEKWKNALETWKKAPFFGVGTGDTLDELLKTYQKNEFDLAVQFRFNPHNQYLQTLVALGLLGLFVLIATFIFLLFTAIKRRDWLFVIFVMIAGISMLTESMLERQKGLVFIVFFSLLFSQFKSTRHSKIA